MIVKMWMHNQDESLVVTTQEKVSDPDKYADYGVPLFKINLTDKKEIYRNFISFVSEIGYKPNMRIAGNGFACALTQNLWRGFLGAHDFYAKNQ